MFSAISNRSWKEPVWIAHDIETLRETVYELVRQILNDDAMFIALRSGYCAILSFIR